PSSRAEAATAAAVEGSLAFASVPMQEVAPLRSRVAAAPVGMTSRDPSTSRSLRDRSGRDDTSQLNNDLPEGRVRRQQVVTTLGFVDRNHAVDRRRERPTAEVRQDLAVESLPQFPPLGGRATAHRDAANREPLAQ